MPAEALGISGAKTVGVRPEHLTVSATEGQWAARVVHVEHLGADTNLYVQSDKAGMITVRLFGEQQFEQDAPVFVSADEQAYLPVR